MARVQCERSRARVSDDVYNFQANNGHCTDKQPKLVQRSRYLNFIHNHRVNVGPCCLPCFARSRSPFSAPHKSVFHSRKWQFCPKRINFYERNYKACKIWWHLTKHIESNTGVLHNTQALRTTYPPFAVWSVSPFPFTFVICIDGLMQNTCFL